VAPHAGGRPRVQRFPSSGWEKRSILPARVRVKKTERKMGGHSSSRRSRAPRRGIMQIASRILPPRHATQAETNCGARLSARRYSRGSFPPLCQRHPRARGGDLAERSPTLAESSRIRVAHARAHARFPSFPRRLSQRAGVPAINAHKTHYSSFILIGHHQD